MRNDYAVHYALRITHSALYFDLQRFADDEDEAEDAPSEETSKIITGGNVTIAEGGTYTISSGFSGTITVNASAPVILDATSAGNLTDAQILTGTSAVDLTINGLNIANPNVSPIRFGSGGGTLTLLGDNVLSTDNFYASAVKIGGGLTINGTGSLTVTTAGYGAGIGTDYGDLYSSALTIAGGTINASANYGAGIGSGFASTIGTVTIAGGTITATSTLGAGIGTGAGTGSLDNAGSVAITGGTVTASSNDGAGIGSGFDGSIADISIDGNAIVNATSTNYGAGIGSGATFGNESSVGSITIGGSANVVATSNQYGAGIGTGYSRYNGKNSAGTISIGGDAKVTAASILRGPGLGAGYADNIALNTVGTISLTGDTSTVAKSSVVVDNSDTTRTAIINGVPLSGSQLTFVDGVQSNPTVPDNITTVTVSENVSGVTNVGKVEGSEDYIYLGGLGVISDYAGVTITDTSTVESADETEDTSDTSTTTDTTETSEETSETTEIVEETTGAKIRYATDFYGFTFDGSTLAMNSSTGALLVQNCKDKIIAIADATGQTTAYVYSPTNSEIIYGNVLTHTEVIAGSDSGADVIFAGDSGSTIWGGFGDFNDTLAGGAGHDEYIYVDGTGTDVVANYSGEDLIKVSGTVNGVNLFGDFALNFSNGSLTVANSQDRLITVTDGDGNLVGRAYYSSTAGILNGSELSGTEVIVGGAFGNNLIIAGDGGSSLWGNFGGVDTLVGGAGHDEFFYTSGSGIVVIQNSNALDTVNLVNVTTDQIAGYNITETGTAINFTDGGAVFVEGTAGNYRFAGQNYVADPGTKTFVAV